VKLGEGYSATTTGGRFKFTGVEPNEYTLSVQVAGYIPLTHQFHLGPGEQIGVTIGMAVDPE
jgi:hypothetical protein